MSSANFPCFTDTGFFPLPVSDVLLFLRSPGSLYPVGNCFLVWMDENSTLLWGLSFGQLFAAAIAAAQIIHMVVAVPPR